MKIAELEDRIGVLEKHVDEKDITISNLEKRTAKPGLIKISNDLSVKNTALKEKLVVNTVELARLKDIEIEYKKMLRKYGSPQQRIADGNTRKEIISSFDDKLSDHFIHFNNQGYSEIEIMNFISVIFLDMSCGMRFVFVSRLMKFSSHGFRSCLYKSLKNLPAKSLK